MYLLVYVNCLFLLVPWVGMRSGFVPFLGQIDLFIERISALFISFDKLPNEERGGSVVE